MTPDKKNANNYKWNSYGQNDSEAHPNRMVHIIIMNKNNRTKSQSNNYKYDTTNEFPFPGYDK